MNKIFFICSILFVISILFSSCFLSNEICFNVDNQSIISCNQKGLSNLYIEDSTTSNMYHLLFNDTLNNNVPKVIYIDSISKLYSIYQGWQEKYIKNQSFKLAPLSKYVIERAQGDASTYKIEVWTDKNGKVVKSSKRNCR